MRSLIITCETLRNEIELVLKQHKLNFDIVWLESGLHDVPAELHSLLQKHLDQVQGYDQVLLALGRCGGALNGLKTGNYETILPKADDCISLFFGSDKERYQFGNEYAAVYLTEGWACGERGILSDVKTYLEEYDEETAKYLIDALYGNFHTLALLDTGAYAVGKLAEESAGAASLCGLKQKIVPVKLTYLEQLLYGPWKRELFYIVPPNGTLTL